MILLSGCIQLVKDHHGIRQQIMVDGVGVSNVCSARGLVPKISARNKRVIWHIYKYINYKGYAYGIYGIREYNTGLKDTFNSF